MPALLAMIPLKDWLYCGAIAAILAGGFYYHHKLIEEGVTKQRVEDDKASATLIAQTATQTAELQARAATAEQAYDKEHNDNQNYTDAHPTQPVRLCLSGNKSGAIVPKAGAANPGNAGAGAPSANLPSVSGGDSGGGAGGAGPDISALLGLLANRADNVSATLREFQSR